MAPQPATVLGPSVLVWRAAAASAASRLAQSDGGIKQGVCPTIDRYTRASVRPESC